jgi:hypothetical protein
MTTSDDRIEEVDGPPPPPTKRALRVMAIVRWVLLALVMLLAGYTVWTFWGPTHDEHAGHELARSRTAATRPQPRRAQRRRHQPQVPRTSPPSR